MLFVGSRFVKQWSCGVILYAMVTGRLPFDDDNIQRLLLKVQAGQFHLPPELSDDVKSLIQAMLTVDPEDRITLEGIKAHPWFTAIAPKSYPKDDFEPSSAPILNPDIRVVSSLSDLGWGEVSVISEHLSRNGASMEKVFYQQLKRHPMFNKLHSGPSRSDGHPGALTQPTTAASDASQISPPSVTVPVSAQGAATAPGFAGPESLSSTTTPGGSPTPVMAATSANSDTVTGSLASVQIDVAGQDGKLEGEGAGRVSSSASWPRPTEDATRRVGPTARANLVRQSKLVRSTTDTDHKQDDDSGVSAEIEEGGEQKAESWFAQVRSYITGQGSDNGDNESDKSNHVQTTVPLTEPSA
jgi:serine/threonine protein kinase